MLGRPGEAAAADQSIRGSVIRSIVWITFGSIFNRGIYA
jgi:hypothetical protein